MLTLGAERADNTTMTITNTHLNSRAVLRIVEPGTWATCAACGDPVKFSAKVRHQQVIANVYVDGVWNRVEHYHADCYETSGAPYGATA